MHTIDYLKIKIDHLTTTLTVEESIKLFKSLSTVDISSTNLFTLIHELQWEKQKSDIIYQKLSSIQTTLNKKPEKKKEILSLLKKHIETRSLQLLTIDKTITVATPNDRSQYFQNWQDFEKKARLSNNLFSNILTQIDGIFDLQKNSSFPQYWFYRMVFKFLNDIQKKIFIEFFPRIYSLLVVEEQSKFSIQQRNKIDSYMSIVEGQNQPMIAFFRLIYQDSDFLKNETFGKHFVEEYKWLEFETSCNLLKFETVDAIFKSYEEGRYDHQTCLQKIYNHKELLTQEQKSRLGAVYANYGLDTHEITLNNISSQQRKFKDTKSNTAPVINKRKKPEKSVEKNFKDSRELPASFDETIKSILLPRTPEIEEIDKLIFSACESFTKISTGNSHRLQEVEEKDGIFYLSHKIIISPDDYPVHCDAQEFGEKIKNRLNDYIYSQANIILVTSNENWIEENKYFKNKKQKPTLVGLTLPMDSPVGTIGIRGFTAAALLQRATCFKNYLEKESSLVKQTAKTLSSFFQSEPRSPEDEQEVLSKKAKTDKHEKLVTIEIPPITKKEVSSLVTLSSLFSQYEELKTQCKEKEEALKKKNLINKILSLQDNIKELRDYVIESKKTYLKLTSG